MTYNNTINKTNNINFSKIKTWIVIIIAIIIIFLICACTCVFILIKMYIEKCLFINEYIHNIFNRRRNFMEYEFV